MEVIMDQINHLSKVFYTIRMLFSNTYHSNYGIPKGDKYFDIEIPTVADDRKNLKKDIRLVSGDLKKAVDQRKAENNKLELAD